MDNWLHSLIRCRCFEPWVNVKTAVEAHRDLIELFGSFVSQHTNLGKVVEAFS